MITNPKDSTDSNSASTRERIPRLQVAFPSEVRDWIEANYRAYGYGTASKFVASIVEEYYRSKTRSQQSEEEITPQEELDRVMEAMGQLNQKFDAKFQAIRTLDIGDMKMPENPEDVRKFILYLWGEVVKAGGYVRVKGKAIPISRKDLKDYESLGLLRLRQAELMKQLGK